MNVKSGEQSALDWIVGHTWYVRYNPELDPHTLWFIPAKIGDHELSQEELETIGEVGWAMPIHPGLLCKHEAVTFQVVGVKVDSEGKCSNIAELISTNNRCPDCGFWVNKSDEKG
jgi:hypothetical protein